MKKLTVLSAVLLCGLLLSSNAMAIPYKYTSKPHAPIVSAGTTIDAIYVGDNVTVSDVRVAIYAKTVMYGSLYITLTSPTGTQVVLKQANAGSAAPLYGFLGTDRSYALFQDCPPAIPNALGNQPNDKPTAPATPFSTLNGKTSAGYWTLTIKDEVCYAAGAKPQDGFLEAWVVMFNAQINVPPTPFTPPVDIVHSGGTILVGQINGHSGVGGANVPDAPGVPSLIGAQCVGTPPNPNGSLGQNGDCFPFIISGHPGAMIGQTAAGYPAGRFVITVSIRTNYPGSSLFSAYTQDIAIFFGKTPSFNGSIPAPVLFGGPYVNRPWPQGPLPLTVPADRATSLLGGSSAALGGIRLAACINPIPDPLGNSPDDGGYDVTFDDLAFQGMSSSIHATVGGGIDGTYRPEQQMTFPVNTLLDGLYYLTVYDTFGEGGAQYGQLVVTNVEVQYVVGGGNIPDPNRHQGIAAPLLGVPIPGTFTGAPLGYLSDIVGIIPPLSINAKDQDPILATWAMEKLYPLSAVGYERITSMQTSGYNPPEGVRYDGPYAYSHPLNASGVPTENMTSATINVNADVLTLPTGTYKLHTNLVQARYDADLTDNEADSKLFDVTNTSMGYYGTQITQWNQYQNPQWAALIASATLGAGTAIGQTFAILKNPATTLTSVDYKLDLGDQVTPNARGRISIWKTSGWLNGAPQTLVARSMRIEFNEYIPGNWRSFPIYPVTTSQPVDPTTGNPTATIPSVSLVQGVYVVTLDNVGGAPAPSPNNILIYPYTYPMVPGIKDRFCAGTTTGGYYFDDLFGPLGSYASLGTRLTYLSTNINNAPAVAWGAGSTGPEFASTCFPFRLNMTTLNDFAINYVRFSGINGNESIGLSNAPFVPTINITACSNQTNVQKDFNIRLEIFDGGNNRVYVSDKVQYINPWQTISATMDSWNPGVGGIFKVVASFSRCPDDQNPVNNTLQSVFFVNGALAHSVVINGGNASQADINGAAQYLKSQGLVPEIIDASDPSISTMKSSTMYVVGTVTDEMKAGLSNAIANNNSIAFASNPSEKIGKTIANIDNVFGIDRGTKVDYENVNIAAPLDARPGYTPPADVAPMEFKDVKTKEDILNYLSSNATSVQPVESTEQVAPLQHSAFENVLPPAISSPYGEMKYFSSGNENISVIYAVPQSRKASAHTDAASAAPAAYALGQNYPNPFNPSTVISYTLPQTSVVTLRIIDVLGRDVATLVSEKQDAGTFSITWKGLDSFGREVASGNYFYRLDAAPVNGGAAFNSMKKLTLSK